MKTHKTHKRCPMCKRVYPSEEFRSYRRHACGQQRYAAYCRTCEREYSREYNRLRYQTDPAYRAQVLQRVREHKQRLHKERQESRQWFRHAAMRHVQTLLDAGWQLAVIAQALGVSTKTVQKWRHGRSVPKVSNLHALRKLADEHQE